MNRERVYISPRKGAVAMCEYIRNIVSLPYRIAENFITKVGTSFQLFLISESLNRMNRALIFPGAMNLDARDAVLNQVHMLQNAPTTTVSQ